MALKSINIHQLKMGMYISSMDINWLKNPFLTSKHLIAETSEIESLINAGAKKVTIDTQKGVDVDPVQASIKSPLPEKDSPLSTLDEKPPKHPATRQVSLDQALVKASQIRNQVECQTDKLYLSLKNNQSISTDSLLPLFDDTLSSLQENDQALLTLVHEQRKISKLSEHVFSVYVLSVGLAGLLEYSQSEIQSVGLAALFHDASWVKLPMNLIGKHQKYTESESKLVQQHPALCHLLLKKYGHVSDTILTMVLQHHERLDGSGYPNNLTQKSIHKLSHIIMVTEYYDEMLHHMNDQKGMLPANAIRQLLVATKSGKLSYPVVSAFIGMLGIYPVTTAVALNTGEKALVVESPSRCGTSPVIKLMYDRSGFSMPENKVINLANQKEYMNKREIIKVINPALEGVDPAGLLTVRSI